MDIKKKNLNLSGTKLTIEEDSKEIARISIIYIKNHLHNEPYALIEDLYVDESYRGKGYARQLFEAAIEEAKNSGSYKIVATSRYSRENVHDFYIRLGFKDYGKEFRLDLK